MPMSSFAARWSLAGCLVTGLLVLMPSKASATPVFAYGLCNPSDGCDQSVNFTPANSGTTVIGDTNPPAPLYDVFVDSLQNQTLHGSGSTVDTGVGGAGFNSIDLRPDAPWAWSALDFTLDSFKSAQPLDSALSLTFTVWDQFGVSTALHANFPWEGNNGENQQYTIRGTAGEVITKVEIGYADPLGLGNTIQDIHNIDVHTVENPADIPEPASLLLLGTGLIGAGLRSRKRR